jgi:hypothetical protein
MKAMLRPVLISIALAGISPAAAQSDLYNQALQSIAEGRRSDAAGQLKQLLAENPDDAGAWVEIGLLQCSLGYGEEAERTFAVIETRFTRDAPLPRAIEELIAAERDRGCNRWQPLKSYNLLAGRGYDRNVNQGASNPLYTIDRGDGTTIELPLLADFLPKRDHYTVMSGEYLREVTRNGMIGFAQFQARHNDHLGAYDSASLFTGIESPHRFGNWTLRATGMLGMIALGGSTYQRQAQFQARVSPPLPRALPKNVGFTLLGSATRTEYLTLENFDTNTFELRATTHYRAADWNASVSAGRLHDEARAVRPGGSRSGWYNNLQLRRELPYEMIGELSYTRQTWRSELPYSPGVIDQIRNQDTQVLRATISYPIGQHHRLQVEARAVRNRENISIFQYNNRQLQVSWQWQGL